MDFYCAMCGSCFYINDFLPDEGYSYPDNEAPEDEHGYLDNQIVDQNSIQWLTHLRLIGENEKASGLKRCFITGIGFAGDDLRAVVKRGTHPNAPTEAQGAIYFNGLWESMVYSNTDAMPPHPIPIHDHCLEIFTKAVYLNSGFKDATIDLDDLYQVMSNKRVESCGALSLDYYEYNGHVKENFWGPKATFEPWLVDPLVIPKLEYIANHLPKMGEKYPIHQSSPRYDCISRLPVEIIQQIYDYLPLKDVLSFMCSSKAALWVAISNSFWKKRLSMDMPYLWEINEISNDDASIDWREVYVRMWLQSYPGGWDRHRWRDHNKRSNYDERYQKPIAVPRENLDFERFDPALLGIASRRRVFNCVQQLVEEYVALEYERRKLDAAERDINDVVGMAQCLHTPRVSSPMPAETAPLQTFILAEWSDISKENKVVFNYNNDGFLCYIEFGTGSRSYGFGVKADVDPNTAKQVFEIPQAGWLEGLEIVVSDPDMENIRTPRGITFVYPWTYGAVAPITPQHNESKRLLVPEPGHTLIGFKGDYGDRKIYRLGIIESTRDIGYPRTACPDFDTRKFLWKNEFPPPHIRTLQNSIHIGPVNLDMTPMESLFFEIQSADPCEDEPSPSTITELAGGSHFQSLQCTLESTTASGSRARFTQTLGYQFDQLKRFPIDGAGGERIIGLALGQRSMRAVTSFHRQVFLGSDAIYNQVEVSPPPDHIIVGVFGSYYVLNRSGSDYRRSCTAIGSLITPGVREIPDYQALKDDKGRPWEPCSPPWNYFPVGDPLPPHSTPGWEMAVFLDLSLPIKRLENMYAAPLWYPTPMLGGFQIFYTDGSMVSTGLATLDVPGISPDVRAKLQVLRMDVPYINCHVLNDEQLQQQNQGDGSIWVADDDDGELVTRVRIWAGPWALQGFQLEFASGSLSPKWGKAGGPPTTVYSTPWLEDKSWQQDEPPIHVENCVGIKFLLACNGSYIYQHPHPVWVQALKMS